MSRSNRKISKDSRKRANGRCWCRASITSCRKVPNWSKQFNFIPHARLDDLMVSYAPKGGGVGPHFDAYDVFPAARAGTSTLADLHAKRSHAGRRCAVALAERFQGGTGMGAGGGRHALSAAALRTQRHRRRRLHDLFHRFPHAVVSGAGGTIPRLSARPYRDSRHLCRPRSESAETSRRDQRRTCCSKSGAPSAK